MAKEGRKGPVMPKGKQPTPEQIMRLLRDAEAGQAAGRSVSQICLELLVSGRLRLVEKAVHPQLPPPGRDLPFEHVSCLVAQHGRAYGG